MVRWFLLLSLFIFPLRAENYLSLIKLPKTYPVIYEELINIRKALLEKDKEKALKLLRNLKNNLDGITAKKIVFSLSVQEFKGVETLKELTQKLSTAKGLCELYKIREAENILKQLRSEVDVNITYISRNVLIRFVKFEDILLKQKEVAYTAALSAIDSLFPEIRTEVLIYPIPLLRIAQILKLKNLTYPNWEQIYINLKMARYMGYLDPITYGDLKRIVEEALQLSKTGKALSKQKEQFKILFKNYFEF